MQQGWTGIITGASRGIGAESARWLARAGADLVIVGRDAAALRTLEEELAELPGRRVSVAADVTGPGTAPQVVGEALAAFGRLDALLNNAGVMPVERMEDAELDVWRRCFETNVFAAMLLTREALPHLRATRGRVINTATALAERPVAALGAYCSSKAALLQATRVLAMEESDVLACAYSPGPVDTGMMEALRSGGSVLTEHQVASFREQHDEGRLVSPVEAGRKLAWLAVHADDTHRGRMVERDEPAVVQGIAAFPPSTGGTA